MTVQELERGRSPGARRRHQNLAYATLAERDVLRALFTDHRQELREWFEKVYEADAFAYGSGRAALCALLRAAGLWQGDEVIVCGFTCLAVPEAVLYAGATPVYADLAPRRWSPGIAEIEAASTHRTRAVIVQHTFGIPTEMAQIVASARRRGWLVIEDCALALGSSAHGAPLGTLGDAAIFSFEMTKTVTGGWGGLAVVRNPKIRTAMECAYGAEPELGAWWVTREMAQVLASTTLFRPNVFGTCKYLVAALYKSGLFRLSGRPLSARPPKRWSYKLPRAHASLISAQLLELERIKARSAAIASRYRRWLDERGRPDVSGERDAAVHLLRFPLLVADADGLVAQVSCGGFELGRWFAAPVAPMPDPPSLVRYSWGACPRAEEVARRVVNLPMHLRMTDSDVERLLALFDERRLETLPLPD